MSPSPHCLTETTKVATVEKDSYGQILKSSAVIGGASAINIAIGIIRTKAMAVLLGPDGFGLMGVYGSIANLAQSIAGMGINSSGVRQIAEAVGSGETERIARTAVVLRRTSVFLGILGAVVLVVCSRQISAVTFGDDQHAVAVALLSLVVYFSLVSGAQGALIQGMRYIADLARMGILGSFFGLLISIPLVYFLREKGVVPSLIGIAAVTLITSWWYSRKVQIGFPAMRRSQVRHEAAALLKLGFAFMASGVFTLGAAYAVRTMVLRMVGLEAAGYYHAAWTLGGLYVGFILQAMGADFYPRLTGVAGDNAECNRLVNEQTQISLLLAGPGVIATLTFASVVIAVFYSTEFGAAVEVLRWICLGTTLQVITWPMGFVIVAKGAKRIFFLVELAWTVVNIGFSWICVSTFGLNGAGIAFFTSYVFHWLLIYPVVRRLSGFRWSAANSKIGLLFLSLIATVFCGFYVLPTLLAIGVGTSAMILYSVYSIRALVNLISLDRIPSPILRLFVWFRLAT
ncbi:MAG: O-antigen translocase [Nitrospira sp.]|nr:O-antigen translocase [Nitrospira sp.]